MHWRMSFGSDPEVRPMADRHYSRRKSSKGYHKFTAPGRTLVLKCDGAYWVTLWQQPYTVKHAWPNAWVCAAFRNESRDVLSSVLVGEAVAATLAHFGDIPSDGFITFVDAKKTTHKRDPGRCFRKAGWSHIGFTVGGLYVLQLRPESFPEALACITDQQSLPSG